MSFVEFTASQYSQIFWLEACRRPEQEQARYHIYGVFEYNGTLDFMRLNDALQAVVNTHYNLRSNFKQKTNDLIQIVHKNRLAKLDSYVVDSNDEYEAILQKTITLPFDLTNDPLFRFTCIQNKTTKTTTFIPNFHHIIIDGTCASGGTGVIH